MSAYRTQHDKYAIRICAFHAQRRLLAEIREKANVQNFKLTRLTEHRFDEAEKLLN